MKRLLLIAALAAASVQAFAQVDTIYLSNLNTTHIRFSSEIKYVDISSKVIAARIVEGSKDILALKARRAVMRRSGTLPRYIATRRTAVLITFTRSHTD